MAKKIRKIFRGVGVMTGTSLDGIDLVCCQFTVEKGQYQFVIEASESVGMDETWQSRLRHLPTQSAEILAKTHVYFGHYLGKTIADFIGHLDSPPDFVACHGQTIFHQPRKSFTTQIGDGETIVSYLPCPLITNFRNKDVALKGEGAPLVPLGEQYLFPDHELFLNLGGICNLTWKGQAFDITACNLVLNHVFRKWFEGEYDPAGQVAASGKVDSQLARALDGLKYYQLPAPKSLGWEWVEGAMLPLVSRSEANPEDILHTLTIHIAGQIARSIYQLKPGAQSLMVTGGGRYHEFLMSCLEQVLSPLEISIDTSTDPLWVEFKEAIIFAFLGLRAIEGKSTTLASVTGADMDVVSGSFHVPPGGGWTLAKL
ncbi:MAG: anhydro-N-acetylmuramic acid kinase [Bacteroidia bacterium]|nr:anhydro-N-acetylmuramic acid kinase [Bacteroidia bacterium]